MALSIVVVGDGFDLRCSEELESQRHVRRCSRNSAPETRGRPHRAHPDQPARPPGQPEGIAEIAGPARLNSKMDMGRRTRL